MPCCCRWPQRLRDCTREDDTVARQGSDEFVVVLEDLGDNPEEAAARSEETVGQKILSALRAPYEVDGEAHHSTLSMGITCFSGLRETVDELLQRTDLAMYQAKSAGRDTLRFYDPQMQAAVSGPRRHGAGHARRAGPAASSSCITSRRWEHGRITGAEALLRWQPPAATAWSRRPSSFRWPKSRA
jgi:predicted signal transduction protein with EAL and GGDEF domain